MATRVYSPAGEPFDIPRRDLADKLILEEGWTQTPPAPKPVESDKKEDKPKRRTRRTKAAKEEVKSEPVFDFVESEEVKDQ